MNRASFTTSSSRTTHNASSRIASTVTPSSLLQSLFRSRASSPRTSPTLTGFTIIELLIVIVVIAILAAVSIVAYRGIQDRANASSAQSLASQTATKLKLYYAENESYPATLSDAGITASGLQYSFNNTTSPKTFCITATTSNKSYYQNNTTNTTPTQGGCSGHGQGGVGAVTNLIANPNFAGSGAIGPGWVAYSHGTNSITRSLSGNEQTMTVTSLTGGYRRAGIGHSPSIQVGTPLSPNTKYVSGIVTLNTSGLAAGTRVRLLVDIANSGTWMADRSATTTTVSNSLQLVLPPSLITVQATNITPYVWVETTAGSDWTGSSTIKASKIAIYLTDSSSFSPVYFDGSSPNWIWNGTPNNSTSTGPAL